MRDFLIQRITYEWFLEVNSKQPNEEKLRELSKVLEKFQPTQWDERFQKDVFYQEHLRRRGLAKRQKHNLRKKALAKVAIILLVISTSAQAACYAITRKSIFYYLNQMKDQIQRLEFKIKSDAPETESGNEGELQESKTVIAKTWKDAVKTSNRSYIWPRKELSGWKCKEISIEMLNEKGDTISTEYVNGKRSFTVVMMYMEGEGGGITEYDETKKKVKELHLDIGDYYLYRGTEDMVIEGFYGNVQISMEGALHKEEAETWIRSLR